MNLQSQSPLESFLASMAFWKPSRELQSLANFVWFYERSISHELLGQLLAQLDLYVCHYILHYKGCATFGHIRVEYQIRQASTTTAMPFQHYIGQPAEL